MLQDKDNRSRKASESKVYTRAYEIILLNLTFLAGSIPSGTKSFPILYKTLKPFQIFPEGAVFYFSTAILNVNFM